MVQKQRIRKLFPASNTTEGFYSFFDYIIEAEGRKLFVLKGGPGVGKSTFMREIEHHALKNGFDVEEFRCSSDPESIDAVSIPKLKLAVVDGTAPHIIEPRNPGITDEIIHLGDFWDREKLQRNGEKIINLSKKTGKLFNIAYNQLKEARVAYDEWKNYVQDGLNSIAYKQTGLELMKGIFLDVNEAESKGGRSRHLFASAITPKGRSSYIESLIEPSMRVYVLEGMPGAGAKEAIREIAVNAEKFGLANEQLHCPIEPDALNMVIIPSIQVVAIYVTEFYANYQEFIDESQVVDRINFDSLINWGSIEEFKEGLEDARNRCDQLINKAVKNIAWAKAFHSEIEQHYVEAMDFGKVAEKRQEVLDEINRRINNS